MSDLQYYVFQNGESRGPFSGEYIKIMRNRGMINGECRVRPAGGDLWATYDEVFNERPQNEHSSIDKLVQAQIQQNSLAIESLRKSTGTYVVLALLLGWIGIHNFYANRSMIGVVQLILGMTGIGMFISIPWALIDALCIRVDGNRLAFRGHASVQETTQSNSGNNQKRRSNPSTTLFICISLSLFFLISSFGPRDFREPGRFFFVVFGGIGAAVYFKMKKK